ncbi:MAG: ABC transporter permease [Syntrophomonadaceae bacterium]
MSRWRVVHALLAKEWQKNRGYFLVTAVLVIYGPVLQSLYYLLQGQDAARGWGQQLAYMLSFQYMVMGPSPFSSNTLYLLGVAAAILLGALLLGEERKGSLTYLLTTPVGRREIVLTKFLFGTGALLLAMAINLLFLSAISGSLGLDLGPMTLIRWGLLMSLSLVGLFTLSFFASTFTSGPLPAAGLSFILIYLPAMLAAMVENIAARYYHVSETFSINAQYVQRYLTIPAYLTGEHWFTIQHVDHHFDWRMTGVSMVSSAQPPNLGLESGILLLFIAAVVGFAVIVFEHLSLEEQGTFFASHRSRQIFLVLGGLLIGYLTIFPSCTTLPTLLAGLGVIIISTLGLFEWLPHRLRR